ncbi:PKD-like family lipoprotein [Sphingobacterium spiritivorum]|uniref:PKD-like family lipoprotein n=1 Tax=Sphingobacterium spiritivorum TaxID=258 RepID=UPI003DA49A86
MKTLKNTRYIIILFVLSAFVSCKKDLGNYDYKEINDLTIEGIDSDYRITVGQNIKIEPKLTFTQDPDFKEEDYSYEWISFNLALPQNEQRKLVAETRILNMPFPFGIGNYSLFYKVTEKSSGISWQKTFSLKVEGSFKGGWAFLSEVNNQSQLDFFEYNYETNSYPKEFRNFNLLFSDSETGKTLTLSGKPKFLHSWANRIPATGNPTKYFLYIGTEDATEKLNLTDGFIYSERYAFKYETGGGTALNKVDQILSCGGGSGFAMSNGDAFLRYATYQYSFGTPINRLSDNSYFKVAPFMAINRNATINTAMLMYDVTNKRFVRNSNASLTSTSPLPYNAASAAFDPNNVGKELIWMGQTLAYGGRAYAVLKDNSGYYLARMNNAASFNATYWDDISALPELSKATIFAVDQQYGYLQYAVGGKLYQYDVDTKETKIQQDYGNRIITMLKYDQTTYVSPTTVNHPTLQNTYGRRFKAVLYGLIVATYDPNTPATSGKVEIYDIPQFNASYNRFYSFEGFGKVADVCSLDAPLGW